MTPHAVAPCRELDDPENVASRTPERRPQAAVAVGAGAGAAVAPGLELGLEADAGVGMV